MTGREIFQIWAPFGKKWTDWVRPVPFVGMSEHSKAYHFSNFDMPNVDEMDGICADAAVIVDLPGVESVMMGISFAKQGYRPIPIFNGTIEQVGARATVDNQAVGVALHRGAEQLLEIEMKEDALPVFLTDSNRMNRYKMEAAVFDNSWDVYPQDLPSAEYFMNNGIRKVVVIGDSFSKDLKKILYDFQKKNMQIYFKKRYERARKVTLHKPPERE